MLSTRAIRARRPGCTAAALGGAGPARLPGLVDEHVCEGDARGAVRALAQQPGRAAGGHHRAAAGHGLGRRQHERAQLRVHAADRQHVRLGLPRRALAQASAQRVPYAIAAACCCAAAVAAACNRPTPAWPPWPRRARAGRAGTGRAGTGRAGGAQGAGGVRGGRGGQARVRGPGSHATWLMGRRGSWRRRRSAGGTPAAASADASRSAGSAKLAGAASSTRAPGSACSTCRARAGAQRRPRRRRRSLAGARPRRKHGCHACPIPVRPGLAARPVPCTAPWSRAPRQRARPARLK